MRTLYLCGAGNPEGVRLAIVINRAQHRWDRIVILDDDPGKKGKLMMGLQVAGPMSLLKEADPATDQVVNLVARTTTKRHAVLQKIKMFGLSFAPLIDPRVDIEGVEYTEDVTVYQNVSFCAAGFMGPGSVALTGCVIGHGCRLGNCCVVAPGAVVNARVDLGDGVYVGTNASILPDLKIGPWATIGANSAVVQNVPPGATVIGVPAQVLMLGEEKPQIEDAKPANGSKSLDLPRVSSPALQRLQAAQKAFVQLHRDQN